MGRLKPLLTTLAVTGAVVGGGDRTPFVGPPRVRVGCWIRVAEQGSDRAGRIGQALDARAAWEMRGRRRGAERSEA